MAVTVSIKESKTILEGDIGSQSLTFDIVLSEAITAPVQVPYRIGLIADTATIDEDYAIAIEPVIFNVGDPLTKSITFEIKGDRIVEADEVFTITLGTPIGATLGLNTVATGTILNDDSLPTITIAPTTNASEANIPGTFTLTRTGNLDLPLTVSIAVAGSATPNNDYQPLPGLVTIAAGQTQAIITVNSIDDDLYEGTETITTNLVANSTYSLGSTSSATISLLDNETLPVITIAAGANAREPSTSGNFILSRTGDLATALTVNLVTTSTSASNNIDFQPIANSITFAAGSNSAIVEVKSIDDDIYEGTEKVGLLIQTGNNYIIGATASAEISIEENETIPSITITPANQSILEKNIGDPANIATFQVQLSGKSATAITVDYTTLNGTATGISDFTATSGQLTFSPGSTIQTISVPITPDNIVEPDETFTLQISNPVGANLSAINQATATIQNDDSLPLISISPITNQNLPVEQLPNQQTVTFNRNGDLSLPLTVKYRLTRLIGSTTQETTNTITFTTGQNTTSIPLTIDSSAIYREIETDSIGLIPDPNYAITPDNSITTFNLGNNQTVPAITITDSEIIEGDDGVTNMRFVLRLSNPSDQSTTVSYQTTDGSATAGQDYTASSGALVFPPREIEQTIDIPIIGDKIVEKNEDFTITLSNPTAGATIANTSALGLIKNNDNEQATPNLTTLTSSIIKIENASSTGTTLKFRKIEHQAFCRNELSLFTVDDDNGTINGIAPGQIGYQNAAIQRSQVVFAALSDSPVDLQLDGQIDRYINLGTSDKLGLLMVVGSSIDDLNQGAKANVLFSFPTANNGSTYTRYTTNGFSQRLAWEDVKTGGDQDFNDLGLEISIEQAPNVIGTGQQGTKDLVDLRSFTGKKTFDISITGDSTYSNTVGFYKVDDLDGQVDGFKYGDSGYLAAALKRIVASGVKGNNQSVELDGESILAPFLIANNSVANVLAGVAAPVYFGNSIGNADKVDHIRLLGDNKFAFEDLSGGGDQDFNDVVLQISNRS